MNKPIDISAVTLKTERLILRPWRLDDFDDFFAYARVDGVGQMAGWNPHKTKEDSLFILKKFIEQKKTFAIEYEGKAIGSLGIELYNEIVFPEFSDKKGRALGFVLSKDYWNRGLMTEAVKAVIRYLFEVEKLDFILCGHYIDNYASMRVQEKCGFRPLKIIKLPTPDGSVKDGVYNILESEKYDVIIL